MVQEGLSAGVIDGGNNVAGDPLLGPLADNGGPTHTMLPGGLSPAIDSGFCDAQVIDQRGEARPIDIPYALDVSDGCDIGAVEVQSGDPFVTECNGLCFVDSTATGAQSGASWTDAFTKLQDALNGTEAGDTIWVADGTYFPDESVGGLVDSDDRTASFQLVTGVHLYGGFAGGETSLNERSIMANPTILSGDLMQDDAPAFTNYADNAYHVVTGSGVDSTAQIDGFVITSGNADDEGAPHSRGGGIYIDAGSPIISHNTILANSATSGGGIYYLNGSEPIIVSNTISGNRATSGGGGILNNMGDATIVRNTIVGNNALDDGGGIWVALSAPTISGNTIEGNSAAVNGGGIYNFDADPVLVGNTVVGNTATGAGGGIMSEQTSNPSITSTILYGNSDATGDPAVAQMLNVTGSTPTVSFTLVESGLSTGTIDGGNNLHADPLLGPLADNGGPTFTMLPAGNSPVLDAGTCAGQIADQRGEARPFDGNDATFPNVDDGCDIGSVEVQTIPACSVLLTARVLFDGPYNSANDDMHRTLLTEGDVPLTHPFGDAAYAGTHLEFSNDLTVTTLPDSVVDWVMVGLRTEADSGQTFTTPALISNNGLLFSPTYSTLCLEPDTLGMQYLTVSGRNHIQVMSATQLDLSSGTGSYDFTTAATQAYPGGDASAQKEVETGTFALFAGDSSIDGQITAADFNAWLVDTKAGATGYLLTDYDMDGQVTASDFNVWLVNTKAGASSKVPNLP